MNANPVTESREWRSHQSVLMQMDTERTGRASNIPTPRIYYKSLTQARCDCHTVCNTIIARNAFSSISKSNILSLSISVLVDDDYSDDWDIQCVCAWRGTAGMDGDVEGEVVRLSDKENGKMSNKRKSWRCIPYAYSVYCGMALW